MFVAVLDGVEVGFAVYDGVIDGAAGQGFEPIHAAHEPNCVLSADFNEKTLTPGVNPIEITSAQPS